MLFNAAWKAKLFDLAAALPLMAWFALAIAGGGYRIGQLVDADEGFLAICSQLAKVAFLSLMVLLIVIRRPVILNARGLAPKAAGIAGVMLPVVFLALPPANLTTAMTAFSSVVILSGVIASILTACWLGRSFAILPQARTLVTQGPYRLVRHPLYLAELIMVFGTMWRFEPPWSICLMVVAIAAQIPRMHYEEQVLMEAFPCYRDYAARTARLLPGVY